MLWIVDCVLLGFCCLFVCDVSLLELMLCDFLCCVLCECDGCCCCFVAFVVAAVGLICGVVSVVVKFV